MNMSYDEMLKRARSKLPQDVTEQKRFAFPKPRSSTIGVRTILHNFKEICDSINRDSNHLLKFFSGELATAGTLDNFRAIFQGKFSRETFYRLIQRYIEDYVICPVCKLPDTKLVKEKRFNFLICEACGAKSSVRPV